MANRGKSSPGCHLGDPYGMGCNSDSRPRGNFWRRHEVNFGNMLQRFDGGRKTWSRVSPSLLEAECDLPFPRGMGAAGEVFHE